MLIECQSVQLSFADHILLQDISFAVSAGDYVCITGPNGSGKSSLLRCLNGIFKPNAGRLLLQDRHIDSYRQKQIAVIVSYVPQNSGQSLPFRVDEFVRMGRYAHQSAFAEWTMDDQHAVANALHITDTQQFEARQLNTLSGGECQRVMIAAALAQDTPIMLLDEPTSFLDPHHQVEVHQLIQQLNREHGKTIIEVTHDINHASQHAKRVLALKQGKILWQGEAQAFMQPDLLQQLYQQNFIFLPHPQTQRMIALIDES